MATTHQVLGTDEIMERYRLVDRRTARRIMDEAGAFKLAGRILVRLEDLLNYEDALRAERRKRAAGPIPDRRPARRRSRRDLEAGWWREPGESRPS